MVSFSQVDVFEMGLAKKYSYRLTIRHVVTLFCNLVSETCEVVHLSFTVHGR